MNQKFVKRLVRKNNESANRDDNDSGYIALFQHIPPGSLRALAGAEKYL